MQQRTVPDPRCVNALTHRGSGTVFMGKLTKVEEKKLVLDRKFVILVQ